DRLLVPDVEGRRRLVEQHDPGRLGAGAGERGARLLPAGERREGPGGEVADVGAGHRLEDDGLVVVLLGTSAPRGATELDDLGDAEPERDAMLLGEHGAGAGQVAGLPVAERTAVDHHLAGIGPDVAG